MTAANQNDTHFSATHATAKPPIAKTRTKVLKLIDIQVNCMNSASQTPGSTSIYDENSNVTTIVTTNGTVVDGELQVHIEARVWTLTVVRHRQPERWSNAQDDAGEYVLKAGNQEQGRVFGVFYVGLLGIQNRWDKPMDS